MTRSGSLLTTEQFARDCVVSVAWPGLEEESHILVVSLALIMHLGLDGAGGGAGAEVAVERLALGHQLLRHHRVPPLSPAGVMTVCSPSQQLPRQTPPLHPGQALSEVRCLLQLGVVTPGLVVHCSSCSHHSVQSMLGEVCISPWSHWCHHCRSRW